MNYFIIGPSDDIKAIGNYPQTRSHSGYNPNSENSFKNVYWDEFPNFTPYYEVEIEPKAKPTNFINRTPLQFGFLIDSKFLNVLKKHKLPPYKCYEVPVYFRNEKLQYYWFHFIYDMWRFINPLKSKACLYNKISGRIIEEISFMSKEELTSLKKSLNFERGLFLKEVVFKSESDITDIVEITHAFHIPLISEKLKNSLESEKLTGFEAKLFDKVSFES